jgi:hypothetical protein
MCCISVSPYPRGGHVTGLGPSHPMWCTCMQGMHFVGNVEPPADCGFTRKTIIAGTRQSDGDSCGVHAVMNVRAAADCDGPWETLHLCNDASADRDDLWREVIAQECLQGYVKSYSEIVELSNDM